MLKVAARETAAKMRITVQFEQAHAGELPFEDASVDVVTLFTNVLGCITPRVARTEALAEASRILRPGGRLMVAVTSVHHLLVSRVAMPLLDAFHRIYNPNRLSQGDKLISGARVYARPYPRSHWFRRGDIEEHAARIGLKVLLSTTREGLLTGTRRLRGAGDFVYVLEKPAMPLGTVIESRPSTAAPHTNL
jgi:SAM-dependent methyltransferase